MNGEDSVNLVVSEELKNQPKILVNVHFLFLRFIHKWSYMGDRQASSHCRCLCTRSSILDTLSTFYPTIYIIIWLKPMVKKKKKIAGVLVNLVNACVVKGKSSTW